MQKNIKTESVADFMARGGNITKVATKASKKTYNKKFRQVADAAQIDFNVLPMALRIKYGAR